MTDAPDYMEVTDEMISEAWENMPYNSNKNGLRAGIAAALAVSPMHKRVKELEEKLEMMRDYDD
jgi:hypothetical protein